MSEAATLFADETLVGDSCPWSPKLGRHSRLHIIGRNLNAGLHPLGHAFLANNGETCRSCRHPRKAGEYWKCQIGPLSHGPATDLRLKWPACEKWEAAA